MTTLRIHTFAYSALFGFLALAEVFHLIVLWQGSRGNWRRVAEISRLWSRLLNFLPAAPLLLLASGLTLIFQRGWSLRAGWLTILVSGFGLLFADGIFGYTPQIRELLALALTTADGGAADRLRELLRSPTFNGMLIFHFLSLPALYLVGHGKPAGFEVGVIAWLEQGIRPLLGRGTSVAAALLIIALEVLAVGLVRTRSRGRDSAPPAHAAKRGARGARVF